MDEDEPSRRDRLKDWLKKNEPECRNALRPFAYKFASLHGIHVDDAVTEMYVEIVTRAWERTDTFTSAGSPRLWLMKFAHFVALRWRDEGIKHQNRMVRESSYCQDDAGQERFEALLSANVSSSQDPAVRVPGEIWAEGALATMPPQHREVLEQFQRADFDAHLAARRLNIEPVTFRKRLERARTWFKGHIAASPAQLVAGGIQK